MRGAGATVEHAGGKIPFGVTDDVWLSECGDNGWIVLTRDKHIRRRKLERDALMNNGVAAFALTSGEATARQVAETIVPLIQKLVNISVSERKPFLYTFGLKGFLSRVKLR
jgi:PIN domain-containing protein